MPSGRDAPDEVARHLLQQFELRRPGFSAWTPEVDASLRAQAEGELQLMERKLAELEAVDPPYWLRLRRAVDEVLLPRYARLASGQLALEERQHGLWRGGDLVARGCYALVGFILGIAAVEIPYIPIEARWFPALLLVLGPLWPDFVRARDGRRYRRALERLARDVGSAVTALEAYRPLSELTAQPQDAAREAGPQERSRA